MNIKIPRTPPEKGINKAPIIPNEYFSFPFINIKIPEKKPS